MDINYKNFIMCLSNQLIVLKSLKSSNSKNLPLKKLIHNEKKMILFKNVIKKETIYFILKRLKEISKKKPKFKYPTLGCEDLYIFNRLNKKSVVKGYFKRFELYPWNLENKKIFRDLSKILNLKYKLDYNKIIRKSYNNLDFYKIQIMHYPYKKGFMSKHNDGEKKSLFLIGLPDKKNLKIKKDGLMLYKNNKKILIDNILKEGDLLMLPSSLNHEVKKNNFRNGRLSLIISYGHFNKNRNTSRQIK